jgi:hypothetical protein
VFIVFLLVPFALLAQAPSAEFFEKRVRPVLARNCYACHGPNLQAPMAGLRVDSREGLLKGGDKGPAIMPGDPAASRLIAALKGRPVQMPPTGKLATEEIAALERWIADGAPWPEERPAATASDKPANTGKHWAFQPLRPGSGAIDDAVLALLDQQGLKPAPEADARTLYRRLYYDLTGLPPRQIPAFDAYAATVEKLLASPQFGERWGRYWLDIARFSDAGFNNIRFPFGHAYRDWVINALNRDLPFPAFVENQIAADLIPSNSTTNLAALGFLAIGADPHRPGGLPDKIDDRIDVVTRGFLGLSVSCARCHDHKYDPIPTADYYSLYGVFLNTHDSVQPPAMDGAATRIALDSFLPARIQQRFEQLQNYKRERIVALRDEARRPEMLAKYKAAAEEGRNFTGAQLENLAKERNLEFYILKRFRDGVENPTEVPLADFAQVQTEGDYNTTNNLLWEYKRLLNDYAVRGGRPHALAVHDAPAMQPAFILTRGILSDPGAGVNRRFLSVLGGETFQHGSGRLDLARAITRSDLAYRVHANRVWQWLFGEGLVRSSSDFGVRGENPTHPELLDALASRLKQHGSIKSLVREIVLSTAYRRASTSHAANRARDPENRLLWRQNRRRLDFEALRDSMLYATGTLDTTVGGPSFSLNTVPADPRRTLYAFVERERAQQLLKSFNFADPEQHTPQRHLTTIPQQALFLINSSFLSEQSARMASLDVAGLYQRILGRAHTAAEREAATRFLAGFRPSAPNQDDSPWRYGTASLNAEGAVIGDFHPFRYFTETAYQNSSLLPDKESGHANLTAAGGDPGDGLAHAVVRRWIAPVAGAVKVTATLTLPLDQFEIRFKLTNGIRGAILSSRHGLLGQWTIEPGSEATGKDDQKRVATHIDSIPVMPGDTIDFVVDSRDDYESDRFVWAPMIETLDGSRKWSATADFRGPVQQPLNAISSLAQVLFMTNEFAHID